MRPILAKMSIILVSDAATAAEMEQEIVKLQEWKKQ